MNKCRLLIADDHSLVRAAIRRLVESMSGIEVVGEAINGREILVQLESLDPDVVMLDLLMPELNGLDAARQMIQRRPNLGIICLTMHANPEYVREAQRIGVRGYIQKESSADVIQQAIQAVAKGGCWFESTQTISSVAPTEATASRRLFSALSPRQREVLQLLVEGHSTRRIAQKMSITEHTVEKHRERIMGVLQVHDIAGLVHFALQAGLTQSDY